MKAEQQQRLRELALIMLRDAHGEDFTDEQAAELPAQIEEYQGLSEAQNILSLLDEVIALRKIISDCANAVGAAVSPECTLAFMQQLPGEIAAVIGRLQPDADRYRHLRSTAKFQYRNGPGLYWYLPRYLPGTAAEQLDQSIDFSAGKGSGSNG